MNSFFDAAQMCPPLVLDPPPPPRWAILDDARNYGLTIARPKDLYYYPIFVAILYLARILFTRIIANPIANYLIPPRTPPEKCQKLEKIWKLNQKEIQNKKFNELSISRTDRPENWSDLRVQRWFRRKRNAERQTRAKKFRESLWRFSYFFGMSCYGYFAFVRDSSSPQEKENWVKNPQAVWESFPYHNFTKKAYYFYMIQMGFYGSLFITVLTDVRRKDFWEQIAHHIVTTGLLTGSYCCGFWRVGIILMLLFDPVDWIIEISKMLVYCQKQTAADIMAAIFGLTWIYTRCYLALKYICYTTLIEPHYMKPREWEYPLNIDKIEVSTWPTYWIFNSFVVILQCLNFYWTFLLLKFIKRIIFDKNKKVEDDRSDAEEFTGDEDREEERLIEREALAAKRK